jgi:hypothetical protein
MGRVRKEFALFADAIPLPMRGLGQRPLDDRQCDLIFTSLGVHLCQPAFHHWKHVADATIRAKLERQNVMAMPDEKRTLGSRVQSEPAEGKCEPANPHRSPYPSPGSGHPLGGRGRERWPIRAIMTAARAKPPRPPKQAGHVRYDHGRFLKLCCFARLVPVAQTASPTCNVGQRCCGCDLTFVQKFHVDVKADF